MRDVGIVWQHLQVHSRYWVAEKACSERWGGINQCWGHCSAGGVECWCMSSGSSPHLYWHIWFVRTTTMAEPMKTAEALPNTRDISICISANFVHKCKHEHEHKYKMCTPPSNIPSTSDPWTRNMMDTALLLRGFSVGFGGIPTHRLHTPVFSWNLYPYPLKPVPLGMGTGFMGYGCR